MLKDMNDKDLMEKGLKVLFRELGSTDAIRFLSMPRGLREEGVQRHRKWQKALDKEVFFAEVFGSQDE